MSLVTTLLSGAVGGLVATFGSKWLWKRYSRPELTFEAGIIREGESHHEEPMAWGSYRVEISNKGKSIASNCKPRIRLIGHRETTEKRPDVAPDGGIKSYEVDVEKRYIIDIVPTWNEAQSPTRIDLNRDEAAQSDLFYVHSEASPPGGTHTKIRFGDRSDPNEVEEDDDRWETRPVRIETSRQGDFSRPIVDTVPEITADELREVEWVEKKISITSADTGPLQGELDFQWDNVLPKVDIRSRSQ